RPIGPNDGQAIWVETHLHRDSQEATRFTLRRSGQGEGMPHMQGLLRPPPSPAAPPVNLDALKQTLPRRLDSATCYQWLRASGVDHGPAFRALSQVWAGDSAVLVQLKLPRR